MFRPFKPGYDPELRKVSSWHSIQSAWMCMDEALRMNDRAIFIDALEMGRLTLDKCWLEGGNGGFGRGAADADQRPVERIADENSRTRLPPG